MVVWSVVRFGCGWLFSIAFRMGSKGGVKCEQFLTIVSGGGDCGKALLGAGR